MRRCFSSRRSLVGRAARRCARDREPRLPPARARATTMRVALPVRHQLASQKRAGRDRKGNRHCPGYGRVGRLPTATEFPGAMRCDTQAQLQRDVLQLSNDRPKTKHDGAGASRHRPGEDQGIAETEFLDRNSRIRSPRGRPTKCQSRRSTTQPSSNHPPGRALKCSQPPMLRYRHIAHIANQQLQPSFPRLIPFGPARNIIRGPDFRKCDDGAGFRLPRLMHRTREITPQLTITWKWNCAIWMPGNEAQKRQCLGTRDTGLTNSHVSYHDLHY